MTERPFKEPSRSVALAFALFCVLALVGFWTGLALIVMKVVPM